MSYDPNAYPPVFVTVDLIVLTIFNDALQVLLVERANDPYAGFLALPGGFIEPDETLDQAARRELFEETGVDLSRAVIEQLRTYGDPDRDPRSRIVSAAYLAFVPYPGEATAGSDAATADWWAVRGDLDEPLELAFDHNTILADAIERARGKLEYTSYAGAFLPEKFTLSELRRVYELVWGVEMDPSNFARKVLASCVAHATGETRTTGGRPAGVYTIDNINKHLIVPFRRGQL